MNPFLYPEKEEWNAQTTTNQHLKQSTNIPKCKEKKEEEKKLSKANKPKCKKKKGEEKKVKYQNKKTTTNKTKK